MKTGPFSAKIVLRRLTGADSIEIHGLAVRCPGAAQWSDAGYEGLGANNIEGWSALRDGAMQGFIVIRRVDNEVEILNLAVDSKNRRNGIASRLLAEVLVNEEASGPRRIFLEVRESNAAARAFYSSQGFVMNGRRRGYYSDPVEDALVLVRTGQ